MRIRPRETEKPQLIAKFNRAIKLLAMQNFFDRMSVVRSPGNKPNEFTNGQITETSR